MEYVPSETVVVTFIKMEVVHINPVIQYKNYWRKWPLRQAV